MRAIVEALVPRPARRLNTDPLRPLSRGLCRSSASGSAHPSRSRTSSATCPVWPTPSPVPRRAARAGASSTSTSRCYLALEPLLGDGDVAPVAPGRAPPPAGRRVPGPDPGPCAARPAAVLPGVRRVRRGRRRPDHLRPRRGRSPLPHRLRRATSRRPPTTPSRSTTAARGRSPTPPAICSAYNAVRVDKVIRAGPAVATAAAGLEVRRHPPDQGAAAAGRGRRRVAGRHGAAHRGHSRAGQGPVAAARSPRGAHRGGRAGRLDPRPDRARATRRARRPRLPPHRRRSRRIDPADLVEVHRRPSRGLPQWIDKWLAGAGRSTTCTAAADRIDDVKVARQAGELADDLAELAALASEGATTRRLLDARARRRRAGLGDDAARLHRRGGGVAPRRPRGPAPGGRPPPRPGAVRAVAAGTLTVARTDERGHPVDGPPGQGAGVAEGGGRSASTAGSCRTGWPKGLPSSRRSDASSTSPSPGLRHRPWCSSTSPARHRSSPSSTGPRRIGRRGWVRTVR